MRQVRLGCWGTRTAAVAVGGVAALVGPWSAPSASAATAHPVPEVSVVVQLATGARAHAAAVLGAEPGSRPVAAPGGRWTWQVPSGEVAATLSPLQHAAGVVYASSAHLVHATDLSSTPSDPCYQATCGPVNPEVVDGESPDRTTTGDQRDLALVDAAPAWAVTHGSSSILVAVLDTGVDAQQEDLSGDVIAGPVLCSPASDSACNTAPNGGDPSDTDDAGHGTHVTGTIAARSDNGVGVASLGWATRAEVFKVLDRTGAGTTTDLATGIYDAVNAGASIINMSLGDPSCNVPLPPNEAGQCGPDPDTEAAVEYAEAHGVVVVAAAGNDGYSAGSNSPGYPAGYPGVLSVAATDQSGATEGYSEWGDAANIAAPGDNVLSTWNTGVGGTPSTSTYAVLSGTSMAAPHVAAAAALVRAADPGLSAAQVTSLLETTAGPLGGRAIDGGLLDAGAAVRAAAQAAATGQASLPAFAGYRMTGADGAVYPFGADPWFGDLQGTALAKPVVGSAARPDGAGYWLVGSDGGIFSFGDAAFHGSTGNIRLTRPVVGMAATPDGGGYWLVASDGGVFAFGDARFFGSTGAIALTRPVVGMAATPDGGGYWLVASDGGVFAFGDAAFHGSTGAIRLTRPVVAMDATSDGRGYWLVASDGGVFSFGDARFAGSTGGVNLAAPIVAAG
ncbi:MAG TPA: S8 family serine peptidase [Acidimicrobiales bacterium]|nr:S8 family serine peptidase [Acidimicrobiales bacterium]